MLNGFSNLLPIPARPARALREKYKTNGYDTRWDQSWALCINDYREHRENKIETPIPKEDIKQVDFPEDGTCSWDYNSKTHEYEYKYTEGEGDRAWMEEKDHDYMRHIARFGTQNEKEQLAAEIKELKTDEGPEEDKKHKNESYAKFFDKEIKKFEEEQRKLKEDAKARAETEQRKEEENQRKKSNVQIENLSQQFQNRENQIYELNQQLQQSKQDINDKTDELTSLRTECNNLIHEKEQIEKLYKTALNDNQTLQKTTHEQIIQLKDTKQEFNQQLKKQIEQTDSLDKKLQTKTTEHDQNSKMLETLKTTLTQKETELKTILEEKQTLELQYQNQLQDKDTIYTAEKTALQNKITTLKTYINTEEKKVEAARIAAEKERAEKKSETVQAFLEKTKTNQENIKNEEKKLNEALLKHPTLLMPEPATNDLKDINISRWYQDDDILAYINAIVQFLEGYASDCSFLLHGKGPHPINIFPEKDEEKDNYYVALTPAIDDQEKTYPIDYYFNKSSQHTVSINERRDLFDELKTIIQQQTDCNFKILFPYNHTQNHWFTGEVQILKQNHDYHINVFAHDPYGGGQISETNFNTLQRSIQERLTILDTQATYQFTRCDSPYQSRRQAEYDGVSCGVLIAEEIVKRIKGLTLDLLQPYPYGARELRVAHIQTLENTYPETDPTRINFVRRNRLTKPHNSENPSLLPLDFVINTLLENNTGKTEEEINTAIHELITANENVAVAQQETERTLDVEYEQSTPEPTDFLKHIAELKEWQTEADLKLEARLATIKQGQAEKLTQDREALQSQIQELKDIQDQIHAEDKEAQEKSHIELQCLKAKLGSLEQTHQEKNVKQLLKDIRKEFREQLDTESETLRLAFKAKQEETWKKLHDEFETQEEKVFDQICTLETRIEITQQNGTHCEAEINKLNQELEAVRSDKDQLMKEYRAKQALLAQQRELCRYPELRYFYRCIQLKLVEVFLAMKSIASGMIDAPVSFKMNAVQKGIELAGEMIDIPGAGIATGLLSTLFGFFAQNKAHAHVETQSAFISTLNDIEIIAESVARELTQRYTEQLFQLKNPEVSKLLGECAVARIMNYLDNHMDLLASGSDAEQAQLLFVQQLITSIYKVKMKQGFWKLRNKPIPLKEGGLTWTEAGALTEPGIRCIVQNACGEPEEWYYSSERIEIRLNPDPQSKVIFCITPRPEKYGYRLGTPEEAEKLELSGSTHRIPSEMSLKMQQMREEQQRTEEKIADLIKQQQHQYESTSQFFNQRQQKRDQFSEIFKEVVQQKRPSIG